MAAPGGKGNDSGLVAGSDNEIDLTGLTPEAVRALDTEGCERLAARIRSFLITEVNRTGGHLGGNLGVVELTIALHRVFRSPDDPIIFDIGHQAYTHKILTGRAAGFADFRQRTGMSGFPSREESPHDTMENSHSSTGPAWGLGITLARGTRSVVVIGDGALTGGVAYEAINAIGVRRQPVVIVYNDNGRSYARTMSRLTLGEPCDAETGGPEDQRNVELFFTALGFSYIGAVDGHDFGKLEAALADAAGTAGPVVVHVRTQKGLGWSEAEDDDVMRLHQVGGTAGAAAVPAAGDDARLPLGSRSWGDVLGGTLCELAEQDPRVHVITAAMPDSLGLLEFQRRFPERYHDVGICEQLAVGLAAGLASQGCRPVFPVFATFLTRAIDQVVNDVALHGLPVTFVVDRGGVTGGDGASSHGIYDVGLLRTVPGLEIYAPTSGAQLSDLLRSAVARDSGPTVVRYAKWKPLEDEPDGARTSALLRRRGSDLCLLAHGAMVQTAMSAASVLEREHGVSSTVWEVVRLRPAVTEVFADATGHRAVITVEDLMAGTGLYADLLTHLADARHTGGGTPATAEIALPSAFLPIGPRDEVLVEFGVSTAAVVERAEGLLGLGAMAGAAPATG
ncbi:1-deoxy-D-xylulose-5-phosphate synthase [Streptomyces sp. CB01881]|uniref:1-deoxy-D-xylulose-5-phosphate synthase n=1 Tax=Streptomyces sp. CB01881 TaxID=2078691 RepID=UPI000CDC3357|nr:1-deoxy-D-xylulose-5-phosphate synthase [Streptomyces sp. CB01881]AUY49099.1 1-deoxy-D-xylulose-5-phosphate synthase [Streptomyces sp. CB01881]TYC77591.1 1-deoxy-D-xylulose-5-phosphate synthase [Streptomyces sp. CB01881]